MQWLCLVHATDKSDDYFASKQTENAQLEVRAVFINCEPDLMPDTSPDFESKRFQREELFKHGDLHNCNKKLALTVKLGSDIDNLSDDYIPIDHVLEGSNRKRVRLLNPYILRLRREQPLQAYKLTKIDTVSGTFIKQEKSLSGSNVFEEDHVISPDPIILQRYEQENNYDPEVVSLTEDRNGFYHRTYGSFYPEINENIGEFYVEKSDQNIAGNNKKQAHANNDNKEASQSATHSKGKEWRNQLDDYNNRKCTDKDKNINRNGVSDDKVKITLGKNIENKIKKKKDSCSEKPIKGSRQDILTSDAGRDNEFDLYAIGSPNLWYQVHVQLFEKVSTAEGKTVWNDITRDSSASVSTISPEWTGQDVVIKYRSTEWISKNDFVLPMVNLCLLTPVHCDNAEVYDSINSDNNEGYIIVPQEDILGLEDRKLHQKRDSNKTALPSRDINESEQGYRRVKIRLSRALRKDVTDKLRIESIGDDRYLTIPHRRPLHAQIDLEARADQNQLVRDGSSGRMTTVVADSTRRTRTILSLEATNTGLVASRFRAVTRNCMPEIPSLIKNNEDKSVLLSAAVMIPPMHNKHFQLELPIELPCDIINCSIALLNDENKSVAVRDVIIKKEDRCFCVWHCDCICLSDDPKLLCREMSAARQAAAGLSTRNRQRRARSVCYQDTIPVNLFVIFTGVLMALLILGFVKGVVGLFMPCIAAWGLDKLIQKPRKISRYYESSLKSRDVQYDAVGWPVHPDTKKRNVRFVSRPMEFILNLIYFVCIPCIIVCDAYKQIIASFNNSDSSKPKKSSNDNTNTKKCFSTHDNVQNLDPRLMRRRGGPMHKWMTPSAERLLTDIWQKGLNPKQSIKSDATRPLLQDESRLKDENQDSNLDSEQDDTEYVLMQMQKSRESLARSQRRLSISGLSSVKIHGEM